MSSSGKSGSCSWNGLAAGTPAKPFGTGALSAATGAAGSLTGGLGAAAATAGALAATATGLETFREPVVALSDVEVLRTAAPTAPDTLEGLAPLIKTPTGRETPVEAAAEVEAATPGRWEPELGTSLAPELAAVEPTLVELVELVVPPELRIAALTFAAVADDAPAFEVTEGPF